MEKPNNPIVTWQYRNPSELDYLRPNGFRLIIHRLPLVNYFCQTAAIPDINIGSANFKTPFVDVPYPGDKMYFAPLVITFKVQEDMSNYIELDKWIRGLGFPESREQFANLKKEHPNSPLTDEGQFSDAALFILDSNNQPIVEFIFENCFPFSLGIPQFDTSSEDMKYLQATASFRYTQFTLRKLSSS